MIGGLLRGRVNAVAGKAGAPPAAATPASTPSRIGSQLGVAAKMRAPVQKGPMQKSLRGARTLGGRR